MVVALEGLLLEIPRTCQQQQASEFLSGNQFSKLAFADIFWGYSLRRVINSRFGRYRVRFCHFAPKSHCKMIFTRRNTIA
jgi:hypothetical protein